MAESTVPSDQAPSRRGLLFRLTAATAALGAGAAAWPLLASLAPAADTLAQGETLLDLAGLQPGGTLLAAWQQLPVMAVHRSAAELEALRRLGASPSETELVGSRAWHIRTWHRALRAELAVFTAICTHDWARLPPPERQGEWAGRFRCPWCGSHYDLAGRPRQGPARFPLVVPPHRELRPGRLLIGRTAPADA